MYRHGTTCLPVVDDINRSGDPLGTDILEASADQNVLSEARELRTTGRGMRLDLIARVRREIEAGTYETPEKWEAALDRLAEDLGRR